MSDEAREWDVWRLYSEKPGCVDLLGTVFAKNEGEAEDLARLKFPWYMDDGGYIDVSEYDKDH